jgi:hypothetical protein
MPEDSSQGKTYRVLYILLIILAVLFLGMLIWMIVIQYTYVPEATDAQFRIKDLEVSYNGSTSIDVLAYLVYKNDASDEYIATHAKLTQLIKTVMDSPSYGAGQPWEKVAKDIGYQMWENYSVKGVSVQIFVATAGDEEDDEMVVPDNVATATYTKGCASKLLRLDAVQK